MIDVKKYIVTDDLQYLAAKWAKKQDYVIPTRAWFQEEILQPLVGALADILGPGVRVECHPWTGMKSGLLTLLQQVEVEEGFLPVISLDPVFAHQGVADAALQITRMHRERILEGQGSWVSLGLGPRSGKKSAAEQLDALSSRSSIKACGQVRVMDDGVWSSNSLLAVERALATRNLRVQKFVIGVKISPEVDAQGRPIDMDTVVLKTPIRALHSYAPGEVMDWLCARDFILGLPYSGRSLGESWSAAPEDQALQHILSAVPLGIEDYAAPYIFPLGDPVHWANIPLDKVVPFSKVCLGLSLKLYEAVEKETREVRGERVKIRVRNLARPPHSWRQYWDSSVIKQLNCVSETLDRLGLDAKIITER